MGTIARMIKDLLSLAMHHPNVTALATGSVGAVVLGRGQPGPTVKLLLLLFSAAATIYDIIHVAREIIHLFGGPEAPACPSCFIS